MASHANRLRVGVLKRGQRSFGELTLARGQVMDSGPFVGRKPALPDLMMTLGSSEIPRGSRTIRRSHGGMPAQTTHTLPKKRQPRAPTKTSLGRLVATPTAINATPIRTKPTAPARTNPYFTRCRDVSARTEVRSLVPPTSAAFLPDDGSSGDRIPHGLPRPLTITQIGGRLATATNAPGITRPAIPVSAPQRPLQCRSRSTRETTEA